MNSIFDIIGLLPLLWILFASFMTSMIHGATGIAGGFLLSALAAPFLGLEILIPVLSITLLISHSARALLNITKIDLLTYKRVMITATPCIAITAFFYGRMSSVFIAILLGTTVLVSIPLRRWAKKLDIKTTPTMLTGAGAIYGGISGMSIGPGMLLMPVMLGVGIGRETFVATLAVIALTTNIIRSSVYGLTDILNLETLLLGILIGLTTIPGTWIGRSFLRKMTDERHVFIAEWLVILGGLNFYWLAYRLYNNG